MFESLLIANRGEIARRIIRTARRMGVRTIAVHSDVDATMPFVREADVSVCIGAAPPRDSYLAQERVLAIAEQTRAAAIHPGYGFLSENAQFADAVVHAGLIWVGAPAAAIRAMGQKDAAKRRMIAAGVPVIPGYLGDDQAAACLETEATRIGFPVMIKAVAGGGGKGMRKVSAIKEFRAALDSCRREALAAFGDDRVLLERCVERPRHIEVQVFGDTHGQIVHLFARDCSLQRRHQKVIEEAPAPGLSPAVADGLYGIAVKAARAVAYVGAGTIEFIADAADGLDLDRIWFMEMNTRLQVEHPVTEAITGQDLVEWQLRVAAGEMLPLRQEQLTQDGWAMEARLYAEDPTAGFLPSVGRLDHLKLPTGIRVDSGVEEGGTVTAHYDAMIAKLIAHAPTRRAAAMNLADACSGVQAWPVKTNAAFLARTLKHPEFVQGEVDTGFIERHAGDLIPAAVPSAEVLQAAAQGLLPIPAANRGETPWTALVGFRMAGPVERRVHVEVAGRAYLVECNHPVRGAAIADVGGNQVLFFNGEAWPFSALRAGHSHRSITGDGTIVSALPGRLTAVEVNVGDVVTGGQLLLVVEAMKMEHSLVAPFDGTVTQLRARKGQQVSEGTLLAQIEPSSKD